MSDSFNSKTKIIKIKHIKGKHSLPNGNCFLSYHNKKFSSYQISEKMNRSKNNSRSNNYSSMNVTSENKSFVIKPKHKKLFSNDLNSKMLSRKTLSKNKKRKPNNNKIKTLFKFERKNPFHTRIKSLHINYKYNNSIYKINKTSISNSINRNKNKNSNNILAEKKKINVIKKIKDEKNNKNSILQKTNSAFEDIEDKSTINTKILEQKNFNLENYNLDNKLLILENKNKRYLTNNQINLKKKGNDSILKDKDFKDFNRNKNRVILKSKIDIIKRNILSSNSYERGKIKIDISPELKNDLNNSYNSKKEERNKKLITNIVKKIKDKIHVIQMSMENNNITRNNSTIDDSFKEKSISSSLNSLKIKKISVIKKNIRNTSDSKIPEKSLTNLNYTYKNISNYKTPSASSKDKKVNNKNKIKIYKRNKRKIEDKKKLYYQSKILHHFYNTFNEEKKNKCNSTKKSLNDINYGLIEETLKKEENNIFKKEKNPKDFSEKSIEKIESISQKGYSGENIEKINQDNFFIYKNFMNNSKYLFMGVCDGHGEYGHKVSSCLVYNIPLTINDLLIQNNIKEITDKNKNQIISTLKNTFIEIDNELDEESEIDTAFSGSTCSSIIFTPSKLFCANVGDSRCILGKYDGEKWFSKNLSNDHKPDIKLEKERILKNGGQIEPYTDEKGEYFGPNRVWVKNKNMPGLAMSRSFGDKIAHSVGVIPEPEIIEYSLLEEDKFIILASDGIWEFISNDECVNLIKDFYNKKDINGAINILYKESSERWINREEIIDDITMIIAFLK